MKTTQDAVIIRAFDDEPVVLNVVQRRGDVLDVFGDDPSKPMPFKISDAYVFDKKLFNDLKQAYGNNDRERLAVLWAKGTQFYSVKTKGVCDGN